MLVVYFLMSLAVGSGTAVQSSVNSALGKIIGVAEATFTSLTVSIIIISVAMLLGFRSGNIGSITTVPPYMLIGGIFGMAYLLTANIVVPIIGVASFISLMVVGQLTTSVILDTIGVFGHQSHPLDAMRVVGVVLLFVGMRLVVR